MRESNHRYTLRREWIGTGGTVNFIGLNPSTADENFEDPTSRRFAGFAQRWGYQGYVTTNLWAFRATDPSDLKYCARKDYRRALGDLNDFELMRAAGSAALVVCCWGNGGEFMNRARDVTEFLKRFDLHCIRLGAGGNPVHPVREAYTGAPVLWLTKQLTN